MRERIKLDPLVNQLVRFKLHELEETKEGMIRAFDEHGYWIEGKRHPEADLTKGISLGNGTQLL